MKLKVIHHYRDVIESDDKFFYDVNEQNISEETHMISNVCVFGTRHSKNGYTYEDPSIDKLTTLTEGARMFINHPSKSESKDRDGVRDIRDWAGVFSSPHRDGEKVMANLVVRPVFWELVKDIATMRPAGVGNSINSRVKVYKDEQDKEHVVDIDKLNSIDIVASAATTKNLFESASERVLEDKLEFIDKIAELAQDYDEETIKAIVFHDLSTYTEGLLIDKIKEKELSRAVSNLNWQASDVIEEILRDSKKKFNEKKTQISGVLDDLENEIGKLLSGKVKPGKDNSLLAHNKEEKEDMDWKDINIEDLRKNRTDIIDALLGEVAGVEKIKKMESDLKELGEKVEGLEKSNVELTKTNEDLVKENKDFKSKLDDYETKDKATKKEGYIKDKIVEAKLPDAAVSETFMKDLMAKSDEDIDTAITDRKDLWEGKSGGIKNSGDERNLESKNTSESENEVKMKDAKAKFVGTVK